ncbi:Acanthamoeba Castellanii profilin Ii, cubic crystal form [Thamnocephalis sphaerospora]|uniref:Profilin n=1 Tax=Thamnocephalis sphaerospora TaxID=78915 RepID=A0A4P9XXR6_9FUNG|nr:Acanthamoeba Castellanii profilin Ii, cubic crystal form [Thamnocephalis sphaerospora]|eukprot:RKP11188.1 Acanthamoeba Castellanii profilin Ii, cubic crystal form [Thamnocephalis sphaerospora]
MADWNSLLNDMVAKDGIVQGAIADPNTGYAWFTTPGFTVSAEEGQALANAFKEESQALFGTGFHLNGVKYLTIRLLYPNSIYGKHGGGGAVCVKTNQVLMVFIYDETIPAGQATSLIEEKAQYLRDHNSAQCAQ